jgi:eukaryotic-like serine/threonine-protein kinase
MAPDPRRQEDAASGGGGGAFTRCGSCGRRVAIDRPSCLLHGPVPLPEAGEAASRVELPRFSGYRTLREIGRGGFGAVFLAEPEEPGPRVAIKLAHRHPRDAELRLLHEITVLSDVGPPHVPRVLGSGRLPGGSPFQIGRAHV